MCYIITAINTCILFQFTIPIHELLFVWAKATTPGWYGKYNVTAL